MNTLLYCLDWDTNKDRISEQCMRHFLHKSVTFIHHRDKVVADRGITHFHRITVGSDLIRMLSDVRTDYVVIIIDRSSPFVDNLDYLRFVLKSIMAEVHIVGCPYLVRNGTLGKTAAAAVDCTIIAQPCALCKSPSTIMGTIGGNPAVVCNKHIDVLLMKHYEAAISLMELSSAPNSCLGMQEM